MTSQHIINHSKAAAPLHCEPSIGAGAMDLLQNMKHETMNWWTYVEIQAAKADQNRFLEICGLTHWLSDFKNGLGEAPAALIGVTISNTLCAADKVKVESSWPGLDD